MRMRSRWRWVLTLGCVALVGVVGVVWFWIVPTLLVARIRKHHEGYVTIRGWWVGWSSGGVTGLTLHESPSAASPVWATAERATTDLSLAALLRGRLTPRWIVFRAPRVVYRIGEDGRPMTRLPLKTSENGPTPVLIAEQGRLTMTQAGRPAMVIGTLNGRLHPDPDRNGARFRVRSGDAGWGSPVVVGRFGSGFRSLKLRLIADPLPADREKAARIPFVTKKVWSYFLPTGPVRVVVDYARPEPGSGPPVVKSVVDFERTRILLPHLELMASDANGRLIYQDQVVRLDTMRGAMVGGRVTVSGTMDFHGRESRYDLAVGIERADLLSFPASWGLDTVGLGGRLTGTARLLMGLTGHGLDVTGSSGRGIVEEASLRGIPLGRLGLTLRGEGLRTAGAAGAPPGVFRPQWLGSEFEVRDVELRQAHARVGTMNGVREVPVSGRLGLRLSLRMPLGTLNDLTAYRGEGTADLAGAAIGRLRLGRLAGRLGLSEGVLDVTDVRGRLVERTDHDTGRPGVTEPPPLTGPLPLGAFRGRLRADLTAEGHAEAEFEGNRLPLSALVPSAGGTLSLRVSAHGESLSDPKAWSASGRVDGPEVVIRSARFRKISATLALKCGRLNVLDLTARLDDRPVTGQGAVDLAAPHPFLVRLDASGLPLADLLALALPAAWGNVSGTVAARAEANGALSPWRVESRGRARVDQAEAGRVPLGDVPIAWETRGDTVVVTAREVQRYGGRLSAEARIPVRGDRPVEGTVTLSRVDTARLSAEIPGALRLTGLADGRAWFRLPLTDDAPPVEGEARLTASRMTVEGVPARSLRATITVHKGVPKFEVHAEGLDGTLMVKGSGGAGRDPDGAAIDADVRAVGFQLPALWEALGTSGPMTQIQGRGAVAARVQSRGAGRSMRAEGAAEVRGLRWGETYKIGHVRAGFAVSPDCWRVGRLNGSLWESPILGEFWRQSNGRDPARYGLVLRLERASLDRIFAFEPGLARRFVGFASINAQGRSEGSFRGRGEFRIERGQVNHLPIARLSIPVAWDVRPEEGFRGTVRIRKAFARLAGGWLRADATAHLGHHRDVHTEVTLEQLDMRAISRAESRAGRPTPGRIDGVITLDSPELAQPQDYTGAIVMDLTGAALVDIPILDRIDSALGSARGAVFDEGDLHARVAHGAVHVERLTLVGPLAQLHAAGTIGLDGRLDLRAFVNTNDTLPENAQVAIGRFSDAVKDVRRESQSIDRVADSLASRLMKFRITGTLAHPVYSVDGTIHVDEVALAFFVEAMRLVRSGAFR